MFHNRCCPLTLEDASHAISKMFCIQRKFYFNPIFHEPFDVPWSFAPHSSREETGKMREGEKLRSGHPARKWVCRLAGGRGGFPGQCFSPAVPPEVAL